MIAPPDEMKGNARFSPSVEDGKRVYIQDVNGPIHAPASAERGSVAQLDSSRSETMLIEDRCSGCGKIFNGALYVFVSDFSDEPPLHAKCAKYAASLSSLGRI